MKLFLRSLIVFLFLIFSSAFFPQIVFAETTPFRSANIVTTDISGTHYTNLNNCSVTDGLTCDRATAASFGNLYFRDFGNYDDFGIPLGSVITKVRIKVTGKSGNLVFSLFVALSPGKTFTSNCQAPSDLLKLFQLEGDTIATQTLVANVTQQGASAIKANCLTFSNFENKNFIFKINYSSSLPWSANIDNFEIAFDYDPPIASPTPTLVKTPLILIPGIGGSELKSNETFESKIQDCGILPAFSYNINDVVWVNTVIALASLCDDYFDVLKLKDDGQTPEYPQIILNGTLPQRFYGNFIKFFTDDGYELNKTLFLFPYDWRKDISLTASLLDQKIESIKAQTGSAKVDIVAHSMGGLVARNYISDPAKAQNVRKLFTLGTPHLGSVKSLKTLIYGDCLALELGSFCLSINPSETKDVIQNMISGYELAPSQEYFNFYNGQDNNHLYPYRNNDQPFNYDQIKSFLTNLSYNTSLFTPSESFHSLDSSLTNTNGVDVTNIAGSGLPTLGQIREKSVKDFFGNTIQEKDGFTVNGDKTVPLFSASLNDLGRNLSLLGNAKVFYTNQEHGNLVSPGPALNLVKNILENDSQLPSGVSITSYSFRGTGISVHSPVNIHAYDSFGNHTGLTSDGDFETNIPGSTYDTLDDAKFIWLPEGGQYAIKFEATGQGSFDFKIKKFENDENTETILYKDIPLTDNTKAETIFDTLGEYPTLLVDEDGNGTTDFEANPDSVLNGDDVFDQVSPQTTAELSGTEGLDEWYKSDVIVTLNSQDEGSGSGVLKTEYSLDNGQTVNDYIEPFTVSYETINKLKFRSIDNAGNEENPKEMEIKIDKTAPEAKIFIEQNKQDLIVEGIDQNPTTIDKSDNLLTKKKDDAVYVITDLAGNSLRFELRERDKEREDGFRIFSIQYNNDPIKIFEDNHYNVIYRGTKDRVNVREQNFKLKDEIKIRMKYDVSKNESTIMIKEFGEEKVKEIREGLILLQLTTNKGSLETKY